MVERYKFIDIIKHEQDREYVDADDYAALEAECARLRGENELLKDRANSMQEQINSMAWNP